MDWPAVEHAVHAEGVTLLVLTAATVPANVGGCAGGALLQKR
ncbi:MAG: hypothetical protein ACI9P3_001375 [Bradyrhizobium sp.]|jgi:hypothetical protein